MIMILRGQERGDAAKGFAEGEEEKLNLLRGDVSGLGQRAHRREIVHVAHVGVGIGEPVQRPELRPTSRRDHPHDPEIQHQGRVPGKTLPEKAGEFGNRRNPQSADRVELGVIVRPRQARLARRRGDLRQVGQPAAMEVTPRPRGIAPQ